jgi:hypothetical protein
MKIGDYESSTAIDILYNDIIKLNPNRNLDICIKDEIQIEDALGTCKILLEKDVVELKKSNISDDLVSHELLHCYFYRRGYIKVRTFETPENIIGFFAQHIENNLMHRLIYLEQKRRNIENEVLQIKYTRTLGENVSSEPDDFITQIQFSMKILDAFMRCHEYEHLFEDRVMRKFPNSFKFARRIYDAVMKNEIVSFFGFRSGVIRGLKEIDAIIEEYNLERLGLNHKISVSFIPSEGQLELKLVQVFDIYEENINDPKEGDLQVLKLISKVEDQACYFFGSKDINVLKQQLTDLTLLEFYQKFELDYVIR